MTRPPEPLWEDVTVGEEIGPLAFPLTVYRLVMAAGANRDFNAIHHNSAYAQASGAPDIYANNFLLQGMWERLVRDRIGLGGVIRRLSGFRMRIFNTVGDSVTVKGRVAAKWVEADAGYVEFEIWSENAHGVSVGPGKVLATMARRADTSRGL
jgi:acyl dehydratase